MTSGRVRRAGDLGLLVDLGAQAAAHQLRDLVLRSAIEGVEEVVVGARTVLVRLAPAYLVDLDELAERLESWAGAEPVGPGTGSVGPGTGSVGPAAGSDRPAAGSDRPAAGSAGPGVPEAGSVVEVPVTYDGRDLMEVADLVGLSVEDVIRRHLAPTYTVGFVGFSPGFAYLTGLDPALVLPRLTTPRQQVPAGSVGIAGEHTGVYPQITPGGWRLIGTTSLVAFDPERRPPSPFVPGTRVRFIPAVDAIVSPAKRPRENYLSGVARTFGPHQVVSPYGRSGSFPTGANWGVKPVDVTDNTPQFESEAEMAGITVIRSGPLTTVQDLGRVGFAHLGVPRAGPVDSPSLIRANRLVGNPDGAACLEATLLGPDLCPQVSTVVALTGGPVNATLDGREIPMDTAIAVASGSTLSVGALRTGLRTYIAVAGGIDVTPVLGSRSTDTLAGLGPAPLTDGGRLPVGPLPGGPTAPVSTADPASTTSAGSPASSGPSPHQSAVAGGRGGPGAAPGGRSTRTPLRVTMGPRDDWFTPEAVVTFLSTDWVVTPACDRTGARLAGPALARAQPGRELLTEPLVPGAIQVPPSGQPIILLANHPSTGGYPVIAVVATADLPRVAQARPGETLSFTRLSLRGKTT